MGERLIKRMRDVSAGFVPLIRRRPKVVLGVVFISIAVLYLLIKIAGGAERVIYKVDNLGAFTERRIFNQSATNGGAAGAEGRDRIVTKALSEIGGDVKTIKDDLSSVKGRVEKLESDSKGRRESKGEPAAPPASASGPAGSPSSRSIPSAKRTVSGRASPSTCKFVAIRPSSLTTKPVPRPCCCPSRP